MEKIYDVAENWNARIKHLKIVLKNSTWVTCTYFFISGCLKFWYKKINLLNIGPKYQFPVSLISYCWCEPWKSNISQALFIVFLKLMPSKILRWSGSNMTCVSYGTVGFIMDKELTERQDQQFSFQTQFLNTVGHPFLGKIAWCSWLKKMKLFFTLAASSVTFD